MHMDIPVSLRTRRQLQQQVAERCGRLDADLRRARDDAAKHQRHLAALTQDVQQARLGERAATDRADRATAELRTLKSQQSRAVNQQWNGNHARQLEQQQQTASAQQQQEQQRLLQQREAQQRMQQQRQQQQMQPPQAIMAQDVPITRLTQGSNPRQWSCPHCAFGRRLSILLVESIHVPKESPEDLSLSLESIVARLTSEEKGDLQGLDTMCSR